VRTLVPIVQGAIVGAVVAALVVVVVMAIGAPSAFPSTVVALPSAVAPAVATPFVRGSAPIVLATDSLGFVPLGAEGGVAVEALSAELGLPNEDVTFHCPFPDGEMRSVRWAGLTLFVLEGKVAGYLDGLHYPNDAPPLGLRTKESIGVGSTRAELVAAYSDRVKIAHAEPPATDIDEFIVDEGTLRGLIEGEGDAGVVITVRAGLACFPGPP
jgi:hypothetical protein